MKIENHIEIVAQAYDREITEYKSSIENARAYDILPDYILNNPDYPGYLKSNEVNKERDNGSGNKEVKAFLMPEKNMKFIQLG